MLQFARMLPVAQKPTCKSKFIVDCKNGFWSQSNADYGAIVKNFTKTSLTD